MNVDILSNLFSNMCIENRLNKLIRLQAVSRGYLTRKVNIKLKDNMNLDLVNEMLDRYIQTVKSNENLNIKLSKKKIRNPNFPSEISENIVKFCLVKCKNFKIFPNWDTDCGDLDWVYKKLEIKCFSSIGPSSFGPNEKWDYLYFLDAKNFKEKRFKLYEIRLSNENIIWNNIKINKKKNYKMVCDSGKRPRICFDQVNEQIPSYCKLIWSGHISELNDYSSPFSGTLITTINGSDKIIENYIEV